jgi:hypothetical protein
MVRHDVHPAGWRALGQALRLEGAACAIAPVGAVPSAGLRGVSRREPSPGRAADNVVVGIILEAVGGKALCPLRRATFAGGITASA